MGNNQNTAIATNEHSSLTASIDTKGAKILDVYITTGIEKVEEIRKVETTMVSSNPQSKKEVKLDEKLDYGLLSRFYYMVIATENFPKDSIAKFKVSIKSKKKLLSEKDSPIKIMINGGECDNINIELNNYFRDKTIINNKEFENKAIVRFSFNCENQNYKNLILESKDKKALLYVTIEDVEDSSTSIEYCGDEDSPDKKAYYYNKSYTLLQECFCDRDMTEEEVTTFIRQLRVLNNEEKELSGAEIKELVSSVDIKAIPSVFGWTNSKIKNEDRTIKCLTEELNKVFTKYKINTCNRKAYFIAQLYAECGFNTSEEKASGEQYELENWENRVNELETKIATIDRLKPKIDIIIERLKKAVIDVDKSQVEEIDSRITKEVSLTPNEKTAVDNYKAIFETEWIVDFNSPNKKTKYKSQDEYNIALVGKDKKGGAKSKVAAIKDNGNINKGDGARYKGKGLIQLTWRNTYKKYFEYLKKTNPIPDAVKNKTVEQLLDRTDNDASKWLSTDLFYATDSAAWFFMFEKPLIEKRIDYDGDTKTVSPLPWERKKQSTKYCTSIQYVSKIVNGGNTHLKQRTNYYNFFKYEFFKIKEICINYDKLKK